MGTRRGGRTATSRVPPAIRRRAKWKSLATAAWRVVNCRQWWWRYLAGSRELQLVAHQHLDDIGILAAEALQQGLVLLDLLVEALGLVAFLQRLGAYLGHLVITFAEMGQ